MSRKSKNYNGKSGGAGFLITLGTIWLLSHGGPSGIVLGILIGAGVGLISSIMGSKLDTTTHNKRDIERQKREEEEAGDCPADSPDRRRNSRPGDYQRNGNAENDPFRKCNDSG